MAEKKVIDPNTGITIVPERDNRLTEFSKKLITDYYLKDEETIQEGFARAAFAWSSDDAHAQRLYDAVSQGWFMFASPVFSNAPKAIDHNNRIFEKAKSMPISCFALAINDNLESIINTSTEARWLSVLGGGVGLSVSDVRASSYKALGVIPLLHTYDADMEYFRQGKCYTPDTEVLTPNGWIKFKNLTNDTQVLQINNDKTGSFVTPLELVKEYHKGDMYNFHARGTVYASVTPNHSMVVERKRSKGWTGELEKIRADQIKFHSDVKMLLSTTVSGDEKHLTPHEKFLIALQADGHIDKNVNGHLSDTLSVTFHFSKKRKINRILKIISECGYDYTENDTKHGTKKIYVRFPSNLIITKNFADWVSYDKDTSWYKEFILEIRGWDTSNRNENSFRYMSTIKENVDIVQTCASLANYGTKMRSSGLREGNRQELFDVYITTKINDIKNLKTEISHYDGYVYCATVESGKLLTRSEDGVILVCGNTRRGSVAAYLDVSHPDLIEFINLRIPTGDVSRKCHSAGFHNAVNITDDFMKAVLADAEWNLIDPHDKTVRDTLSARDLWNQILDIRYRTGEPYLHFIDTANKWLPEIQKKLGLKIKSSNLCVSGDTIIEIDHNGKKESIRIDDFNEKYSMGFYDNVLVKSYDITKNVIVWEEIVASAQTGVADELYEIESDDGKYKIRCTAEHKIFTKNRGYVEAQYLTENDDLIFS